MTANKCKIFTPEPVLLPVTPKVDSLMPQNRSRSSSNADNATPMFMAEPEMQRAALSEHDLEARTPIHLFIDEAQHYVTPTVGQILTETRKYKLYLTLANQFLDQITDRQVRIAVEGNTEIKLVGRQTDPKGVSNLSKITEVDSSVLTQLPVGRFLAKIGELPDSRSRIAMICWSFRHSMSAAQWDALKRDRFSATISR